MRCIKNIFILLLCFVTSFCFAQKEDRNWVFGDSVCVDFNNLNSPQVVSKHAQNYEANASLSYPNGTLRCHYSSPDLTDYYWGKIINDQNQVMENGDSINQYNSATNGALFIPYPDDSQKLIFFHIEYNFQTHENYLSYSLIDFNFNSGHGKVVSKNIFLADSITEHLLGIRHGNGRDWWVITKKIKSNKFIKYLITPNGITNPISQSIGSYSYVPYGESASTKEGDKLAFVSYFGNEDVFDFDRCSGNFSNWIELGSGTYDTPDPQGWEYYGCEFSPDGKRIFISRYKDSYPHHENIFQFTLNNANPVNTKVDVLPDRTGFILGQLQLGPDEKIYSVGLLGPGTLDSSYKYLTVINNPNDSGLSANLNLFSFYLQGKKGQGGLPNMPNYYLSSLDGSACDTLGIDAPSNIEVVQQSILNIYPNPATNELTIEILKGIAPKQIEITNSLGVTVMQLHQTKPTAQVNIRQLSAGVYFVKVKMQDGSVTVKRFVKL